MHMHSWLAGYFEVELRYFIALFYSQNYYLKFHALFSRPIIDPQGYYQNKSAPLKQVQYMTTLLEYYNATYQIWW